MVWPSEGGMGASAAAGTAKPHLAMCRGHRHTTLIQGVPGRPVVQALQTRAPFLYLIDG